VADRAARLLIAAGGIGTIVAVSVLCLFLVAVVVPLFRGARHEERPPLARGLAAPALGAGMDDHHNLGWVCTEDGDVRCFALAGGRELARVSIAGDGLQVLVVEPDGKFLATGAEPGSLATGSIGFTTRFVGRDELPDPPDPGVAELEVGSGTPFGTGWIERISDDQFRLQEFTATHGEPLRLGGEGAIRLADRVEPTSGSVFATLADDRVLRLSRTRTKKNLLTGKETVSVVQGTLELELAQDEPLPRWLALSGLGDNVFLVWPDGTLWRCNTVDLDAIEVVEKRSVLPGEGRQVTALAPLLGRSSLAVGDSAGEVHVWFRTRTENAGTPDGAVLADAHHFALGAGAVTALAPSLRNRMLVAGTETGEVRLLHVTSGQEIVALEAAPGEPLRTIALAPRDDGLMATSASRIALWDLDAPHPEVSLAALFRPVWYEGYPGPENVWQSSGGTDDFEPKYGLLPLIFGTIKATIYSLLFGVPIALLAAVYSSEFLSSRTKARVKPTIEMMASLPSVVLGFLAALVFAPFIEDSLPQVLVSIAAVPFTVVLAAYVWRTLPSAFVVRWEHLRLVPIGLALVVGLVLGRLLGPLFEAACFGGDFRQWLSHGGPAGDDGTGGWIVLLFPLAAVVTGFVISARIGPAVVRRCRGMDRTQVARIDLLQFVLSSATGLVVLVAAARLLALAGFDPRGGVLDTYVQRNALVVGFVMGFAIIPIIYTIAEDALSAVPGHLRAASLAAGATPWQTTLRVIVPTAMSGIFSAVMVGFGRAVGETMIVLMAAGNTPVMEWNVFNGFRTLSANIAVELPEAVQHSTHFRMLFLAALVLFGMTFVLNTAAEAVRLRYRKRRVQL
jgi:phosphate transport system permease protein